MTFLVGVVVGLVVGLVASGIFYYRHFNRAVEEIAHQLMDLAQSDPRVRNNVVSLYEMREMRKAYRAGGVAQLEAYWEARAHEVGSVYEENMAAGLDVLMQDERL